MSGRRGDDHENYGSRNDDPSRGYENNRSTYRDDRQPPMRAEREHFDNRRGSSPSRGRMVSDSRPQRGGEDDSNSRGPPTTAFPSRGGGRGSPPARGGGHSPPRGGGRDYGAPQPDRGGGHDGGRFDRRDDRTEQKSSRPSDSSFRRDDHDDRMEREGGRTPNRGNYGNDVRGASARDDGRGDGMDNRRDERNAQRGGGVFGMREERTGNGRDAGGGRGGYTGGEIRSGGDRGGGGYGGDREGGISSGYGGDNKYGGGRSEREDGAFGGRGGEGAAFGSGRGGHDGGYSGGRDNGYNDRNGGYGNDNRDDGRGGGGYGGRDGGTSGFSRGASNGYSRGAYNGDGGGRGGGGGGYGSREGGSSGFSRGGSNGYSRGAYNGDGGGRGGGGGYEGNGRGSAFGNREDRDDGAFGSGRNSGYGDREERGRGSFGGGRGGRGGRGGGGGGGYDGDRGDRGDHGSGFGGDRNKEGGFGGHDSGFGGGGTYTRSTYGEERMERDYDAVNLFDKSRMYAPRGYKSEARTVEELYESDARNATNQILDADMPVKISGPDSDHFIEIKDWNESQLDQELIDICMNRCRYTVVRPIQAIGIPVIMAGRDVLAQSETGSGKSAAFMLPIVHEILEKKRDLGMGKVASIMVAPTRELAMQLFEQARRFTNTLEHLKIVLSIGQSNYGETLRQLSLEGAHILVCTIGRLKDHIKSQHIHLDSLRYFVLDEADRMLEDKNGTREMEFVFNHPKWPKDDIQYLLFSATIPPAVKDYASKLLKKPIIITPAENTGANRKIKQIFYQMEGHLDKTQKLLQLITDELKECEEQGKEFRKTLIFVNKKDQTNVLAIFFSTSFKGIRAQSLHGAKGQDLRDEAVKQFRNGEVKILIGTDVAERGLDIEGLEHVINFDMPTEGERYTHRIGRTGRVRNGTATSFICNSDVRILPPIVQIAKAAHQEVPQWMEDMANGGGGFGVRGGGFGNEGGGFGSVTGAGGFSENAASTGGFDAGGFNAGAFDAGDFGSAAPNGVDSTNGYGAIEGASDWGNATTNEEEKNPFDVGRVKESLEETTFTPDTPTPSITAPPANLEDDDW